MPDMHANRSGIASDHDRDAAQITDDATPHPPAAAAAPAHSSERTAALALSVIIPALNESTRLPPYLESIRTYMDSHYGSAYELIVVDDGSTDTMPSLLVTAARNWPQLHTIRHAVNRGKGAAVRTGVAAAKGARLLYADADGATPIEEENRLRRAIDAGADIAVGSRLLAAEDVVRRRTWNRALIGRAFATVARQLVPVSVRDTQCGFKMLRAEAGNDLFSRSREDGYLFDIEILALARQLKYNVVEVPINWSDQPGSQLNLRRQALRVFRDLWRVRRHLRQTRSEEKVK